LRSGEGVYLIVVPLPPQLTKVCISGDLARVFSGLCRRGNEIPLGVSFVFYTMQLRERFGEKLCSNSWTFSVRAGKIAVVKRQQKESLCTFRCVCCPSSSLLSHFEHEFPRGKSKGRFHLLTLFQADQVGLADSVSFISVHSTRICLQRM
jgi:hypothetical protein